MTPKTRQRGDDTAFGRFPFGLSEDEERRAERLLDESVVVDMLFQGPCGRRSFPGGDAPEVAAGASLQARLYANQAIPIRDALAGRSDELRRCWEASGITLGNRQAEPGLLRGTGFGMAQAQFDGLPWLDKALRVADVRRAKAEGRRAGLVSAQDTESLADLDELQIAHDLGLRMLGLTYNVQNRVGSGCTERVDGGVTHYGAALIARMDELGIVVDTSHSGPQTTLDACALSERPVVASHTSARDLFDVPRAKRDDELRAIAETGGVVGVYAVPFFLAGGEGVTIEAMLDHIDHLVAVIGWRHVGIGTDWPLQVDRRTLEEVFLPYSRTVGFRAEHGVSARNLVGFDDYRDFPNIARGLVARGYADEQIAGILGENVLRVLGQVCG